MFLFLPLHPPINLRIFIVCEDVVSVKNNSSPVVTELGLFLFSFSSTTISQS
ncbi:hypothetical protein PISS_a1657 [Pseudoalteromonas issachenkonii]|uniref:Uncharacterized protein n=1 Tax=Pseudoalteromonas issachenkonii TaxID=152297 RepID=A0ABM6N314_9GAMM|nr:hypothetical protein PISS_a1657 [Pseudoalteromonas issachenkonii]ATD03136.1 hypothetical protein PTET_a1726 [Pseudoalteromonas tetraodonis]